VSDLKVVTFFYGSYINPAVLREVDVIPDRLDVARLPGFDIQIRPLANLVPSDQHIVYGILAIATHVELGRLYDHARDVLGGVYLPQAVLAHTLSGQAEPALCYLAPDLKAGPASPDYVGRIVEPARNYGFPAWYIRRLESFLP
jgi:hypothetical protein